MIGERMKELRQTIGISAEQVAAFLNVSPATVYRYENGDISKMPAKFIKPLAEFLHTTPANLMGWEEPSVENQYSDDERRLVIAYRSASHEARGYAMDILEKSAAERKQKETGSSSARTAS